MVVVVKLPLQDWPKLQKFKRLQHFRVAEEMAPEIRDAHIQTFSRLKMPMLRQVSLAYCAKVTDDGIQALARMPSIEGFQLIGIGMTDRGMRTLATAFPRLTGINVDQCRSLTVNGFMSLARSKTITSVGLSLDPFSQTQIEKIISSVASVKWWTISDPHHRLNHASLRRLGMARKITIQVADENDSVTSLALMDGSQP